MKTTLDQEAIVTCRSFRSLPGAAYPASPCVQCLHITVHPEPLYLPRHLCSLLFLCDCPRRLLLPSIMTDLLICVHPPHAQSILSHPIAYSLVPINSHHVQFENKTPSNISSQILKIHLQNY